MNSWAKWLFDNLEGTLFFHLQRSPALRGVEWARCLASSEAGSNRTFKGFNI